MKRSMAVTYLSSVIRSCNDHHQKAMIRVKRRFNPIQPEIVPVL